MCDAFATSEERQQVIHSEVQAQKEAVTAAQFKFFETALLQDQNLISKVNRVPLTIKSKLRAKLVEQRQAQADSGQRAATGYQEPGLSKEGLTKRFGGFNCPRTLSCE